MFLSSITPWVKRKCPMSEIRFLLIFFILVFSSTMIFLDDSVFMAESGTYPLANEHNESTRSTGDSRNRIALGFEEKSTGLPQSGDYNFVAYGDFNKDGEIDVAFGGEDWDVQDTVGVYAYTGNGGSSWSNASTNLWPGNSWGGLAMADADGDGFIELYATDEDWGTQNNSGVKVWEYVNGSWTDSKKHVSTPATSGRPCNVLLLNVTGDEKLDMVICRFYGMKYFENSGGNPVTWVEKSSGLPTNNWYTTAAVTDINSDGLADIVCCRNDQEYIYLQSTTGNLWQQPTQGISIPGYMTGAAIADVNSDSHNDLIFGTCTPSNGYGIKVLLGNSGGLDGKSFSWTSANTGLPTSNRYGQVQVVDIDLDGDLDIIGPCATNNNGMEIYLGNGSTNPGMNLGWTLATNANLTTSGDWYSANCVDINGDGGLDILGTSWGSGVKVWINNLSLDMTPPGAVNDLMSTQVTETSLTIKWSAPADNGTDVLSGPVQGYDIRYSKTEITSANWPSRQQCIGEPTPTAPGTEQGYTLTGLSLGTQYYVALKSVDERPNWSVLSNIVVNSTLGMIDTTRPGQITDLQVQEITHNSINLTWSAPADNGSDVTSGPVTDYDIRYYSDPITNGTWPYTVKCTSPITPNSPGTIEIYTVAGLQPETIYYFALKARDEKPNWGWISNCVRGTTLIPPDIIPPSSISDLNAAEPTENTINLTWSASGDDGNIGSASYYDIRYSTTTITSQTWSSSTLCLNEPVPQNPGKTEQYQVTGLTPATTYYFGIKVGDETPSWSALSNIATGTTILPPDIIPPNKITDLMVMETTQTTIALSWSAPGDDDLTGQATAYDLRYAEEIITSSNWNTTDACSGVPTPKFAGELETFIVTGLNSNSTYYFGIKASDEVLNWSPLSNVVFGTTLPQPIQALKGSLTTEKTIFKSGSSSFLVVTVVSSTTSEPVSGVTVKLSSTDPTLQFNPETGETNANGVLSSILNFPEIENRSSITIYAVISKIDYLSMREQISVIIEPILPEPKFNLHITTEDISYSPIIIKENDIVILSSNISNLGPGNATGFNVRFLINDTLISEDILVPHLKPGESIQLELPWLASAGEHKIRIEVIPVEPDKESDPFDNSAERDFKIELIDISGPGKDDNESDIYYGIYFSLIIVIILITLLIVFSVHRIINTVSEPSSSVEVREPAPDDTKSETSEEDIETDSENESVDTDSELELESQVSSEDNSAAQEGIDSQNNNESLDNKTDQ